MGLFGWFDGPAARIEKAKKLLERGHYMDARDRVAGLTGAEAEAVLLAANRGISALNLEEARGLLRAGEGRAAQEHLDLARQFGASEEELRTVRKMARELRDDAKEMARAEAALPPPPPAPEGDDPLWNLPPDDPRLRYALLLEAYPAELRARLLALGSEVAAAVQLIDEGNPSLAREQLVPLTPRDPVVYYERARAALAAENLPAAAGDLQAFGEAVGHVEIGASHTGVMLAQVLGQLGRGTEALAFARSLQATTARLDLRFTIAGLLEQTGDLVTAENELVDLARSAGNNLGVYRSLARVRVRLGNRGGAVHALETGLNTCCSSPGKCGNQKPDVQNLRMLAQIYLEDRAAPARADEVLAELSSLIQAPAWEDRYLVALAARNRNDPDTGRLVAQLERDLNPADPRRSMITRAFATA
jgi:hypothetical protein